MPARIALRTHPIPLFVATAAIFINVFVAMSPSLAAEAGVPADRQIADAVTAAPEAMRESATVLGYTDAGKLVTLRKGDGELICLADDPSNPRFHVACYHRSLEPFMARGRELRAEGLDRDALVAKRREEIADGSLPFPSHPATLYTATGPKPDDETSTGTHSVTIYVRDATGETTGLTTDYPGLGAAWLMAPGEPWAHIMVSTPWEPESE